MYLIFRVSLYKDNYNNYDNKIIIIQTIKSKMIIKILIMIILLFKTGSEKDLKRLKSHRPKLNVHCFYFVKNLFCQ